MTLATESPSAIEPSKILVIEDDHDARENMRDILELDNYPVDTAATLAEALDRDDWSQLAAVILDRKLPDGSAHGLLPTIRKLAPEAAVVIVTGYSDLEGAIDAMRLGAADYIVKPVNADSLRLRLGRLIAQRRLAKEKERSDSVFRHLVEAAECLIVMLRADHTIAYFSPHAEALTGYPACEAVGQNFLELFVPTEEREIVADQNRRVLAGEPLRAAEGRVIRRDGSLRWIIRNARSLGNMDGNAMLLVVGHDITDRKRAEERALQSERLAAIGHMVAGLAHESRNALQRSQACLDMLSLKVKAQPDALNLITRAQAAQDDLERLFEDVRTYAAPIKLERRVCDLGDVWREAWATLDSARRNRPALLHEHTDGAELCCEVDPFRLGQVFRNIFDNSLAACQGNAEVHVTALNMIYAGAPALRVAIRDNGPGLSPEQRLKIFDSFFTTKTKGTGLGMAIVKRIIDAHGGYIDVGEDTPGAEIILTLPKGTS